MNPAGKNRHPAFGGATRSAFAYAGHPLFAKTAILGAGLGLIVASVGDVLSHMLAHVLVINIAAPILAVAATRFLDRKILRSLTLPAACQLTLFLAWHTPLVHAAAAHSLSVHLAMLATLLLTATWFWASVIISIRTYRIAAIAPLLLSGKLVCLIAVLLVLSPHPVYASTHVHIHPAAGLLADQQAAGLLMLTLCPLTYIAASIWLVWKWLAHLPYAEPAS